MQSFTATGKEHFYVHRWDRRMNMEIVRSSDCSIKMPGLMLQYLLTYSMEQSPS